MRKLHGKVPGVKFGMEMSIVEYHVLKYIDKLKKEINALKKQVSREQ